MKFNLSVKLVISHICMGIIPMLFISGILWITASNSLKEVGDQGASAVEHAAHDQLSTMCQIKEKQISSFFKVMEGQMYMMRDNPWLLQVFDAFDGAFTEGGNSTDSDLWQALVKKNDPLFRDLCINLDWNNLFLINPAGNIIYSTNKGSDLGMSLGMNSLRHTSLGKAFARLRTSPDLEIAFGDYAPYAPLDNDPSAFLITPIKDGRQVVAYLAVQPSTDSLKNMIKMGSSKKNFLESYLVGMDGYMRSDSVLDPVNYSRAESFRQGNKVDTAATQNALNGMTGTGIIKDYRGDNVLSSWTAVDVFGIRWALICEVDEMQAMAARTVMAETGADAGGRMEKRVITALLLTFFIVGLIAWLIARSISMPIVQAAKIADLIASGDFDRRLDMRRSDEIGQMADALDRMVERVAKNFQQKSGMAELSDQMRGELDVRILAQNIVTYLATFLNAQMASLYLVDHTGESMTLAGSYAFNKRKGVNTKIRLGEGIAGQAALEKNMISVVDLPADYVRISSTLGDAVPVNILAVPFSHENKLTGVIEFASFKEFSDAQMNFLGGVTENVAIAFKSARSSQEVKELLEETRQQSEELKQQSEELMATNEELESQTVALKDFQQELKNQQEELKATNADLEEKSETLLAQKNKIKQRNQDLIEAREKVEERSKDLALASKYKSEFLANMSHELRTPLNSLLLLAQSLTENKGGNLTEKQRQSAGIIVESGNDLLDLINEILDLSKIEAGQVSKEVEDVPLSDLADNARTLFSHMAEMKGLEFAVTIEHELPASVSTDRKRVEQILKNFIGNSIKFTSAGRVDLTFSRPAKTVMTQSEHLVSGQMIAISVSDTGIGIPAEKQKAIFEAFQQADGSTARKYGGTGLGLSISKELAALLGGEIQLVSEPGKGSTFTLYLPLNNGTAGGISIDERERQSAVSSEQAKNDTAPDSSSAPGKPSSAEVVQEQRIQSIPDDRAVLVDEDKVMLIIEDDQKFAGILLDQCHESGFKALVTANGEEGLELADQYRLSGIILDIRLPGIDGWTVLNSLKSNPATRHIPVHMMSAEEVSRKALHQGAIGFLSKPVTREQLTEAFDRFESIINKKIKNLLVVEDDDTLRGILVDLVGNSDTETFAAKTGKEAREFLLVRRFDCMVLDLGLPDCNGIDLLRRLTDDENVAVPPVIIYTGRDLTREEERELNKYSESIIIKDARSQERLLDETSLFLHRMIENMPVKKQKIIADLYDRDKMFQDKKVLLVDDDMRNVFALSSVLEEKGMEVIIAEDGKKALEALAQEEEIDIVLMDIMMPEMDGYEATRKIRRQKQFWKLPVIALTAKAMKDDRDKCVEAGASDYLAKPVDLERLFSMMRVWLYR